MKNTLLGILGALIGLLVASELYHAGKEDRCEEAWDRMRSLVSCVETPGCMFNAEDMFEAKKAHSYHDAYCPKEIK